MNKLKVIINTDPGIDDAVALVAAVNCEKLDVQLITTVYGNVSVEKTTNNALKLMEFLGKDIPIAGGSSKPLIRHVEDASHIHGESGMDGYSFPEPKKQILQKSSIEEMWNIINNSKEKITLITLAPLTDIALLLLTYPDCKNNIEEIISMGGSTGHGNCTPAAEFNICIDPEAAKIVYKSGIPIIMVGLDVTNKATFDLKTINELKNANKVGDMFYSMFKHYRGGSIEEGGLNMHDLCTITYLMKPDIFQTKDCFVDVETSGEYTQGYTVADFDGLYKKNANAKVCIDINVDEFRKWTLDLFNKMGM